MTGFEGRLAKSHVIPDAFMRRLTEAPFKEWAVDQPRPRTRFTGWYDTNLLSPAAEKLVAEYDNEAAKVFLGA
ncbi:MAG: hypothetical protein Q8J71_03170, partial [Brevundimonas sp.]|nr:hypothetical protein [Brevundimonas sp.]